MCPKSGTLTVHFSNLNNCSVVMLDVFATFSLKIVLAYIWYWPIIRCILFEEVPTENLF